MKKGLLKMVFPLLASLGILLAASVSHAAIPNMKGIWKGTFKYVEFENVLVVGAAPEYGSDEVEMKITTQKGRLFAGRIRDGESELKVTGFIDTDDSVTIQLYEEDTRIFFSGKLIPWTTPTLRGTAHLYEVINISLDPRMATGLLTLKRVSQWAGRRGAGELLSTNAFLG